MEPISLATVICPRCQAEFPATDTNCRRCATAVAIPASHQTRRIASQQKVSGSLLDRPWMILLLILHVGVLGAPIYWRTRYSLPVRLAVVLLSILYTVLAVAGIIWGSLQLVRLFQAL